jgi:hypothetical protein
MPYYRLGGPYAEERLARFTKRLVFSCWKVVPKVIATLLSYAAERQAVLASERAPSYDPEARKRRGGLLRFARDQGHPGGMPLLVLLYPGVVLARACDPWAMLRTSAETTPPAAAAVLEAARKKVLAELEHLPVNVGAGSRADENWYWAAPLLMDAQLPREAGGWLGRNDLEDLWYAQEGKRLEQDDDPAWIEHLRLARRLLAGEVKLGPQPKDLADVLARMALAAPGVCALRALCRVTGGLERAADPEIRDYAFQMAWSFRSLFNQPEVTSLVRGLKPGEPYWQKVLEYCLDGCLQAVLDEYSHILREACGLLDSPPYDIAEALSGALRRALGLRSVVLRGDDVRLTARDVRIEQGRALRCRFALRYGDEKADEEGELARSEVVREAFNSPFWPFVLATTSVGQEGLDFHQYCHAVVHWNLPRNPVDFEQREGRVHRYKGLAVRRNLVMRYGPTAGDLDGGDPWEAMFARAVRDRPRTANDLIPFWVYPVDGGAFIERHVPALPLSRDVDQLARLRRSLAVYRMVFGQPSQEDMIAYLLERLPEPALRKVIAEARIDLSPGSPNDLPRAR